MAAAGLQDAGLFQNLFIFHLERERSLRRQYLKLKQRMAEQSQNLSCSHPQVGRMEMQLDEAKEWRHTSEVGGWVGPCACVPQPRCRHCCCRRPSAVSCHSAVAYWDGCDKAADGVLSEACSNPTLLSNCLCAKSNEREGKERGMRDERETKREKFFEPLLHPQAHAQSRDACVAQPEQQLAEAQQEVVDLEVVVLRKEEDDPAVDKQNGLIRAMKVVAGQVRALQTAAAEAEVSRRDAQKEADARVFELVDTAAKLRSRLECVEAATAMRLAIAYGLQDCRDHCLARNAAPGSIGGGGAAAEEVQEAVPALLPSCFGELPFCFDAHPLTGAWRACTLPLDFEDGSLLGEGTFGQMYGARLRLPASACWDDDSGCRVAVKVLQGFSGAAMKQELETELFFGQHMHHPALPRTYGYYMRDRVAAELPSVGLVLDRAAGDDDDGAAAHRLGSPGVLLVMEHASHGSLDKYLGELRDNAIPSVGTLRVSVQREGVEEWRQRDGEGGGQGRRVGKEGRKGGG